MQAVPYFPSPPPAPYLGVVIPSFYPAVVYGGPIFSSYHTCLELAKRGQAVRVFTTNTNKDAHLDVTPNQFIALAPNLHVKYYHDSWLDRFSLPLFQGLRQDLAGCDLVHVQAVFNSPTPWALYLAGQLDKPVVLSPRGVLGTWIMNQGVPLKRTWLRALIAPFAHRIHWHATAEQEAAEIRQHFPQAKIFVVPNGIDTAAFRVAVWPRAKYLQHFAQLPATDDPVIVSMGRLHAKKGFDILLEAYRSLLDHYPTATLLIAGPDEGAQAELEALIRREGLSRVRLVGSLSGAEKATFLAGADAFALPSHNENFGNVYAEALAAGTPVVASRHTPWQAVEAAGCGHWVDNTPEATAKALRTVLAADRTAIRQRARQFVARYDWSRVAEQLHRHFDQIRDEHRTRKPIMVSSRSYT